MIIDIHVDGVPESKGSWIALAHGRVKADNPREKGWATAVGWAAKISMRSRSPIAGRVRVDMHFKLPPRPDKTRKNQRDVDKLVRSCLDAITGIVIADDELVWDLCASKRICEEGQSPGVDIHVFEMD